MMAQFDHRETYDVDIFLPDAQRFQLLAVERIYGRQTLRGKHVHQLDGLEIRPSDGSHRKTARRGTKSAAGYLAIN
jgi:hypothetical protein